MRPLLKLYIFKTWVFTIFHSQLFDQSKMVESQESK